MGMKLGRGVRPRNAGLRRPQKSLSLPQSRATRGHTGVPSGWLMASQTLFASSQAFGLSQLHPSFHT